jgi:hypothetical protein
MPIMLSFGIWVILKIRKSTISAPSLQHKQNALFFLLIGISASLPLMVTFEQRGFYLNTSLPYFALALASYSENWLSDFQKSGLISTRIQRRIPVLLISIASLGIIGLLYFSGKPKRDSEQLNDFNIISKMVGKEGKMITTKACWENYTLHNYLQRYCQISLYYACDDCPYMIIPKNEYQSVSPEFQKLTLHTTYFNIYKRTYGIETKEPEF